MYIFLILNLIYTYKKKVKSFQTKTKVYVKDISLKDVYCIVSMLE